MSDSPEKPLKTRDMRDVLGCLFSPVLISLFLVLALLSIPWGICFIFYDKILQKRIFRRLQMCGRTMDWNEVEHYLQEGSGTLIVEQINKRGSRFWWTLDNLVNAGPKPILEMEDLEQAYVTGKSSNPFVTWCQEKYVSIESGKALLTRLERTKLPPGPVTSEFFLGLYPKARVVHTVRMYK